MGLDSYTSPLFGTKNMGQYSPTAYPAPPNLTARNRASKRTVNSKGQVTGADIYMNITRHDFGLSDTMATYNLHCQCTLVDPTNTQPRCILAIPATYGNQQYTEQHSRFDTWAGCIASFHDMPTFHYYVVGISNKGKYQFEFDNRDGSGNVVRGFYQVDNLRLVPGMPKPTYGFLPNVYKYDTSRSTLPQSADFNPQYISERFGVASIPDELERYNSNTSSGVRWYSYSQDIVDFDKGMIASLRTGLSHWKDMPNSIINKVTAIPITDMWLGTPTTTNRFGAYIATGLPIFTVSNLEEMVKYFQDGNWIAENDDVIPPPKDWSTDWKIYVKGAQKPDIWVTMSSAKVDEWLSNLSENVAGATKEDISVEYRYREYELDAGGIMGALPKYTSKYTVKRLGTDQYNNTKATSYSENIVLNYPLISSVAGGLPDSGGGGEFSDYDIENLKEYYAELGFRLKYGKYKSTWCRYEIGVIGSPSIPDFTQMHNIGTQDDGWQDESTVELIYDQIPEGEEPYPDEPEPDMPDPKPTDPTPSDPAISGLGLLTTTYKITNANAQALGRFFWGGDLFEKIKALNMSPIENVVGLVMMPINVEGTPSVITIGNVDTNINGDVIKSVPLYELGSIELKGRYGSFLDYEPYTSAFIFLPFVGFVRLDPAYFTNKTLKVVYAYDIICGLCKAMLFADGIYVESHQGQCGIEIPLIASNRSQLQLSLASSLMESTASAATGNFAAAAGQLGSGIANYVSGFHTNRQGNYSPTTAWNETRECFIVIESVNASRSSSFAHDYGLPCAATYNIGQLSGFTQCAETVDVRGISGATEEEKAEIYTLLTGGFFA